MNRAQCKRIAQETVAICQQGFYSVDEKTIDLRKDLADAKKNTILYSSADFKRLLSKQHKQYSDEENGVELRITIVEETTLAGAARLHEKRRKEKSSESDICLLSFASAKNPGGGFLQGAQAQEESLARNTGIYHCIHDSVMYEENERNNNRCLYQNMCLYTPRCPIFRDAQTNELLETPFHGAFITMPAPNAEALKKGVSQTLLEQTLENRINVVLAIAAEQGHKDIILGAFGCGVFGNDLQRCALAFRRALLGQFKNVFRNVVFSITADKFDTFRHYFGLKYISSHEEYDDDDEKAADE